MSQTKVFSFEIQNSMISQMEFS